MYYIIVCYLLSPTESDEFCLLEIEVNVLRLCILLTWLIFFSTNFTHCFLIAEFSLKILFRDISNSAISMIRLVRTFKIAIILGDF